jgi:hypothetical protein
MHTTLISILLTLFGLSSAASSPPEMKNWWPNQPRVIRCMDPRPVPEMVRALSNSPMWFESPWDELHGRQFFGNKIPVDVYFHIVHTSQQSRDQIPNNSHIAAQMTVLNDAYAPHGFIFNLNGTDYFANDILASGPHTLKTRAANRPFFETTRKGGYDTLNVYVPCGTDSTKLGIASFPAPGYAGGDKGCIWWDLVEVTSASLPGSPQIVDAEYQYGLGKTLVHEVGHWLSLFHTFEGGLCFGPGDYVDDTPHEKGPAWGCPKGRVTCPEQPGEDAVENYMNYSNDSWWVPLPN